MSTVDLGPTDPERAGRTGSGPRLPGRASARQWVALDCVGAAGYVAVLLLLRHTQGAGPVPGELSGWAGDALTAAIGLPLAVRRLWPVPVLAVVLVCSVLALPLGVLTDPFLGTAVALYSVAVAAPGRGWALAVVVGALGFAGTVPSRPETTASAYWWQEGPGLILLAWLLVGGAWTLGRAVRRQRITAARAAEQLVRQAVTRERLRIARELHDVVAHSVGIIAVKAGVANHVLRTRPGEVADALRVIETTSRDALAEMRQMLGVLRSEADADGPAAGEATPGDRAAPDLAPAPGPTALPALVGRAASSGVRVELAVGGMERVSEAMGLTIYRIVQESLTNVAKHAAPTGCRVAVEATGNEVLIQVTDDGPGTETLAPRPRDGSGPSGHGLIGMRERVLMYGGTFSAGPRPEGGFQVTARIPFEPGRRATGART